MNINEILAKEDAAFNKRHGMNGQVADEADPDLSAAVMESLMGGNAYEEDKGVIPKKRTGKTLSKNAGPVKTTTRKAHVRKIATLETVDFNDVDATRDAVLSDMFGVAPEQQIKTKPENRINKNVLLEDLKQVFKKHGFNPELAAEQQVLGTLVSNLHSVNLIKRKF